MCARVLLTAADVVSSSGAIIHQRSHSKHIRVTFVPALHLTSTVCNGNCTYNRNSTYKSIVQTVFIKANVYIHILVLEGHTHLHRDE